MPDEQFCAYCGRELVVWKRQAYHEARKDMVFLRCPKRRWWNQAHSEIFIRSEIADTVLNFDPFTGERIKHDSKRVS